MKKIDKNLVLYMLLGAGILGGGYSEFGRASDKTRGSASASTAPGPVPSVNYTLPNGVSSLDETYQDWKVICRKAGSGAQCMIVQQLVDEKSHQRILTLQLSSEKENILGTAIMPFGLALDKGISFSVGNKKITTVSFSTCIPRGCLVPLSFSHSEFSSLSEADKIKIKAITYNNSPINFIISTKGLKQASKRAGSMRVM